MPDNKAEPILELVDVRKTYPGSGEVLAGVSLSVCEGETVAIVGPSGSGKSTLLNLIGGLDWADEGSVLFRGANLSDRNEEELAQFRNREIGFVFQSHHLLPQCSTLENVLIPTLANPKGAAKETVGDTTDRAKRLLARVGLEGRLHHRPGELSGGERQRAAFVRALINRPGLLLADEPTGSLDRKNASELGDLLIELNREEEVALIAVTHSTGLADKMETTYELSEGRFLPSGVEASR